MYNGRPHPGQTAKSFWISCKHVGQEYPNGLVLPHFGQILLPVSTKNPQCMQGCL
jgi:hypothetical protein